MHEEIERREGGTTDVRRPRWMRGARQIAQGVAAAALLAGGVVFTLQQRHPTLPAPAAGIALLPATVVEAPSFADEAVRLAGVLRRYTKNPQTADRIAGAIVHEGVRRNLDPALLVGVLLTEDATLDTTARSIVGARGLMQVMPLHAGKWGCGSSNLFSIESNICHGASILQDNMRSSPNTRVALLKYNGCVVGRTTPKCHTYPDKVLRATNRTLAQLAATTE